jgi:putative salt-induced outer membrane protein YdiY
MRIDRLNRIRHTTSIAIVLMAAILAAGLALAEEGERAWQPPPPMPDKFDWVMLKSGEWLKGKIIAMYDDELEFDSDELDEMTLDWGDIQELRSGGTMQIGFERDVVVSGQLFVEGNTIRVMGEEDQSFPRSDLLTITPGAPKEINYWSGKITVGANIREGNTEQTEFSSQMTFKRRTPTSRVNFDYLGNFNRTFGNVAADNQRVSAGWNRYFSKRFFWTPAYGEYYRDPFQNIGSRWTLGMGLGYTLIDTSKIDWEINGGLAYQTTQFDDVLEGESDSANTPALVIGTLYDHKITKSIDFIFDYTFYIVNEESGTYTHHLLTGLEFELTSLFDFDITLVWDRIQDPRENSDGTFPEQDDFRLTFGLGIDF